MGPTANSLTICAGNDDCNGCADFASAGGLSGHRISGLRRLDTFGSTILSTDPPGSSLARTPRAEECHVGGRGRSLLVCAGAVVLLMSEMAWCQTPANKTPAAPRPPAVLQTTMRGDLPA